MKQHTSTTHNQARIHTQLRDALFFEMFLTGSDLVIIKEARMRFPGRRGDSDLVDFHLYPLSLFEWGFPDSDQ